MIKGLISMVGGVKMKVVPVNKPLSLIMYLLIIIVDILLRSLIFMYCYNNVIVKINNSFREIDFNESILLIIMVSCLTGL